MAPQQAWNHHVDYTALIRTEIDLPLSPGCPGEGVHAPTTARG